VTAGELVLIAPESSLVDRARVQPTVREEIAPAATTSTN
jgi:hypothetical protein